MIAQRNAYVVPLPVHARDVPSWTQGVGRELVLGQRTVVMGILNVTPDSFSDGGVRFDASRAVDDGLRMLADGARIIDVGGESTRPGAEAVGAAEELRRVLPVVEKLAACSQAVVSIDTYKAEVAREAIAAGASIVNDISGLQFDPALASVVADTGAAIVLMHMRGRPREMYQEATYADVAVEIASELEAAIGRAIAAGISRDSIIVDPGIGFAKRAEHSYEALRRIPELARLDRPILAGPSRKSFLRQALGDVPAPDRDWGTAAAVTASVLFGAHLVRVHAVKEMAQVVRVADQLRAQDSEP